MTRGSWAYTDDDRAVYVEVGRRIRAVRTSKKLSQQDVAEQIGRTRGSIANIETGRQGVSVPMLLNLADALNVEPADLLGSGIVP